MVEILLSAGASVEEKDWNGMTALIWAADIAPKRVIEILLTAGANIEAKDNSGFTPLMMAAKDRPKEIVDMLLRAGARLEVRPGGSSEKNAERQRWRRKRGGKKKNR